MEMELFSIVVLIGVPISAVIAFSLNNYLQDQKSVKPFKWGFYQAGLSAFVAVGFALEFIKYMDSSYVEGSEFLFAFLIVCAYGSGSYLLFKRKRSGAIITTVLNFNPVSWMIHYDYYKKRWSELGSKSSGASFKAKITTVIGKAGTVARDASDGIKAAIAHEGPNSKDIPIVEGNVVFFQPPVSVQGKWSNERYTIVLLPGNVEVIEHGSGSMKFPSTVEERPENGGYSLVYKDPYTLAQTSFRFIPIDDSTLTFILDRDGYNIEITEEVKRVGG